MKAAIGWLIGLVFVVSVWAEPLIEGRVRLESGEPVADAQVRIFDMTDLRQGAIARAMTDGTGYFALPLAALGGRALPQQFALGPNYPNPFNPSTIIPYQLAVSSQVRLEVFNLLGQHLATLVDGERAAGFHTATWNATDGAGRAVGAGVYIYRMTVGVESQTGRMVLVDGQAGVSAVGAASVWSGASVGRSDGEGAQVYGLIVSGSGLVPYVDSSFRVEAGMAPVELVVSAGPYSAGKATDDACAFCGLLGAPNDEQEEEEDQAEEEEEDTPEEEEDAAPEEEDTGEGDLIVYASISKTSLRTGQAFTLRARVQNQGTEEAQELVLSYYRSADATISTQDTQVGTDAVGRLAASSISRNESISLTAPSTPGTYYYGACVASGSGESDTDNNCSSAVKITVSGQEEPEEEEDTLADEDDDTPVTIPDANLRTAIAKALGKARSATITVADMKALTRLDAGEAGIGNLTGLAFATNLKYADLWRNRITNVSPLSGLTNLERLSLEQNNIRDISSLARLTNLTFLSVGEGPISDLSPLSGLTKLRKLKVFGTSNTDLSPLSGLTKLRELTLSHGRIEDISALEELTGLTRLWLWENQIEDISALSGFTDLTFLSLGKNNVSDISALSGLTNLTELFLQDNNITEVSSLSGLTDLTFLELSANSITDISPLSNLINLRELYLSANSITDISPLSGLTNLQNLDLRGNPYEALPKGDFDIELVLLDDFTESQKNVLQYVARRWMAVITEDLPDYKFTQGWSGQCGDHSYSLPAGERIDDLRIYVSTSKRPDFAHGGAGLHVLRAETHLPVIGCMSFDLSHANLLITGLHEIGHVLGVGTRVWDNLGFRQDPNGDEHFNGPLAIAAFDDAGGRDYTGAKVPVEGSHWRGDVFGDELMTPTGTGAISAITVQSLADLGYGVDVTQADAYTLPGAASAKAAAKIAAALPSIPSVDGIQADAYAPSGADQWQGKIAGGLLLLPGDDRLRGRLESAEWMGDRGFDLRDGRLIGRLAPSPRVVPEMSCGVDLRQEPIYVVDPQGRIIRTLGD